MKRLIIKLFLSLCLWAVLPVCAQDAVHYYFRTMDIRNGLSQNTVYQILQDRKGFMWFGTKDGLNRYDGLFTTRYWIPLPLSMRPVILAVSSGISSP